MRRYLPVFLLLSLIPAGLGCEAFQLYFPALPEVARPRTAEFGTCVDAATDSEVERCGGGIPWASDIIAFVEFTGEWNRSVR